MDDLAPSSDQQDAEDWMYSPAPAPPGRQLEQVKEGTEQHAPSPVQQPDADEPSLPIQASAQAFDDSDSTEVSFEDTIRKYIPDESDLALSLQQRDTLPCLVNESLVYMPPKTSDLDEINDYLIHAEAYEKPSLLVIQDANIHWSKALCARYPESLSPDLLAGHIIRFDKIPSTYGKPDHIESHLKKLHPNTYFDVSSSGSFMMIDMATTEGEEENRFDLDFIFGTYHGEASMHLRETTRRSSYKEFVSHRSDVFERDEQNNWRRISVRLSCIRLAADFHIILIDSAPKSQGLPRNGEWHIEEPTPITIRINNPFIGELRLLLKPAERVLSTWKSDAALDHVLAPFRDRLGGHGHTLQSVLNPHVLPIKEYERTRRRGRRRAQIFFWLLTEASWRRLVAHMESRLHELQREATTIAGDQAFGRLTDLRRQLVGAYGMLAEAQQLAETELRFRRLSWDVDGETVSAEAFWSEERVRPKAVGVIGARSIDIRDLPELLEELLKRIELTTRAVNEEIQMVIGSVQVEDARVMRRQTEWTVVLAVLAAIYLPMTLVTGLFGMNITEIDAGTTAPDRWSVVKAWGVVFGATMGSVLVYAVVRYVLRYRRVGRMLLGKKMRNIGDGSLHRRLLEFKDRVRGLWLYRNIRQFRKKMREWDEEAQKMDKME